MIDLDRNATTTVDPRVREAMFELCASGRDRGNPSSIHRIGQQARGIVEDARRKVAHALGAEALDLVFTSGGTESNNLAIQGAVWSRQAQGEAFGLLTSRIEHPSIIRAADRLANQGVPVHWLGLSPSGQISIDGILEILGMSPEIGVISLALANHELGNCYAIGELARAIRERFPTVWIHCDAVQALGKVPVRFSELGIDLMSVSAHKVYGPVGVGALLVRKSVELTPVLVGGQQERGLRPGTESPFLLHGFALAVELARIEGPTWHEHCLQLRHRLLSGLSEVKGVRIHGDSTQHIGNTLLLSVENCPAQLLLINLDLEGVAVSAGAACSSGTTVGSSVLANLGFAPEIAESALRISVCKDNTLVEVERFLDIFMRVVSRMRSVDGNGFSKTSASDATLKSGAKSGANSQLAQENGVGP